MTTSLATWDYEGYWNTVLGGGNASCIVREFDLSGGTERDLDEWLGHAEAEAWASGGRGDLPEEWSSYHQTALAALVEAAAIYVVWGAGASSACGDLDSAPALVAWTPWAGRELVGDEWVVAFVGDPSDLDRDEAVIGYRQLADHEIRDWRSRRTPLIRWSYVRVWEASSGRLLPAECRIAALRELRERGSAGLCDDFFVDPSDYEDPDNSAWRVDARFAGPSREDIDWTGFPED